MKSGSCNFVVEDLLDIFTSDYFLVLHLRILFGFYTFLNRALLMSFLSGVQSNHGVYMYDEYILNGDTIKVVFQCLINIFVSVESNTIQYLCSVVVVCCVSVYLPVRVS